MASPQSAMESCPFCHKKNLDDYWTHVHDCLLQILPPMPVFASPESSLSLGIETATTRRSRKRLPSNELEPLDLTPRIPNRMIRSSDIYDRMEVNDDAESTKGDYDDGDVGESDDIESDISPIL